MIFGYIVYRIAEDFRELRGFVAICESFLSAKLGGVASFGGDTSEQSVKVFSLESFPLYGIPSI